MYTLDTYDIIAENEYRILNDFLKLESIHPIDIINNNEEVLNEASIDKSKIEDGLDRIIDALKNASKKFKSISRQLKTKNVEWMAKAERFDLDSIDLSNFKKDIFPYWEAIPSKFSNISIPKFKIEDISLYEDSNQFMNKYFKDIIDDDGNVNKNILRGLTSTNKHKVTIEYGKAKSVYRSILNVINEIYSLRDKVSKDMLTITATVKKIRNMSAPLNESILLEYSLFKDEYFDILLEGVVTPDKIERDNQKKNNIVINNKNNIDASELSKQYKAVARWAKLCSAVTTAEMDILDEAYSECVKFISKVMRSK